MAPFDTDATTLTIEPTETQPWDWPIHHHMNRDISTSGTSEVLSVLANPGHWMQLPANLARKGPAPERSYTIWFSQRTGSTLLCKALESTGVAGVPSEWLLADTASQLYGTYEVKSAAALQLKLWELASTSNGVCGIKYGMLEPHFSQLIELFRQFPGCDGRTDLTRGQIWENAFPNGKHVYITRRNKVRLAVSWWKALQTQEWHRETGNKPTSHDVRDLYDYTGIRALYIAASMREAGIQEFFTESGIVPFSIVYEDYIVNYEKTVYDLLDYLEIPSAGVKVDPPYFGKLADRVSDEWAERFRQDAQAGWGQRGW